jgi:hypothetical protein
VVDGSHCNGNVSDKRFRSVARLEEVRRLGGRLEQNAAVGRGARVGGRDPGLPARREERRLLEAQKEAKARLLKTLEAAGERQVSRADPDTRLLGKRGQAAAGYNVQIVVDAKHKLIVADEVAQDGNDLHQLHPMLAKAKAALGAERPGRGRGGQGLLQPGPDRPVRGGRHHRLCAGAGPPGSAAAGRAAPPRGVPLPAR